MADVLRLKLIPAPTLKCRVKPYFPGTVAEGAGIDIANAGGVYTVSWDAAEAGFSPFGMTLGGAANAASASVLIGARERLTANRDYFVKTPGAGGSDAATGRTLGTAFATVAYALSFVCSQIDLNGHSVQIRVQGGTYTENITLPSWLGYTGGYTQLTVIGENGTVTLNGATAQATVLAAVNVVPALFKNMTIGNANAAGIAIEGDNNGIVALDTITFGVIGAGGLAIAAFFRNGSVVLMPGTFTFTDDCAVGIYIDDLGSVICQAGVTIALGAGRVFSSFFVGVAGGGEFYNSGLTVTGSLGSSSVPWRIDANTFGRIFDLSNLSSISGAGTGILVPLINAFGGTGVTNPAQILGGQALNVNLNSANTDNAIPISLPAGVTNYIIEAIIVRNKGTTASLTTATAGLFSTTGGGGLALAANQALAAITSNAIGTDANALALTQTVASRTAISTATLQFRVGTAQGAAATADVYVFIRPLP